MLEEKSTPSRSPTWWKDDHETAWTRVKGAFHRDWQQTRSDVSGGRTGLDLNQSAGDTVAQALGNKRIPPDTITNPMTDAQRTAHVARAAKQMERSALELGEDEATAIDQKRPPRSDALGQWEQLGRRRSPASVRLRRLHLLPRHRVGRRHRRAPARRLGRNERKPPADPISRVSRTAGRARRWTGRPW